MGQFVTGEAREYTYVCAFLKLDYIFAWRISNPLAFLCSNVGFLASGWGVGWFIIGITHFCSIFWIRSRLRWDPKIEQLIFRDHQITQ